MNTDHFRVQLSEADRAWLSSIYENIEDVGLSWESFRVCMELALKKGLYEGAKLERVGN